MDEPKDYQFPLAAYLCYLSALYVFQQCSMFLAFEFPKKYQLLACAMFMDDVLSKDLFYIKQFEFPKKELATNMSNVYGRCYVQSSPLYIKQFEFSNLSVDDSL